jgi:hypothetical protein
MQDIVLAIRVGSPLSSNELVKNTFESIIKNIGTKKYIVLISLGRNISTSVRNICHHFATTHTQFLIFQDLEIFWSDFINEAIIKANEIGCKYFIKSHDDIELETPNFFEVLEAEVSSLSSPLGWISFTDTGWKRGDFSPAVREGYHIDALYEDALSNFTLFQFNKFPKKWFKNSPPIHAAHRISTEFLKIFNQPPLPYPKPINKIKSYKLDMPYAPIRVHAPYNHFVAIKLDTLNKIGYCSSWSTKNSLYVDEDWGLRSHQIGFSNIWIPKIEYFHYRGQSVGGSTRSLANIIFDANRVEALFELKWGFRPSPSEAQLQLISRKYSGTLIPWSIGRRSYEWDYIN